MDSGQNPVEPQAWGLIGWLAGQETIYVDWNYTAN